LGTAINGAVDSPVQGGVKLYRQTFLDREYESTHPEQSEEIDILRAQILEYASVIDQALDLHAQVCKDFAFHEALRSREYLDVVGYYC
jgi:dedicator of cytokinesis protein 3